MSATREEIDKLLEAATAPAPERTPPKVIRGWKRTVREFLRDQRIEPGVVASVEVSTLYRMFKTWVETTNRKETVSPITFAKALKRMGFRRRRPRHLSKLERDRKCLAVRGECALRLIAWERAYPDTDDDRRIFLPATRWNR